MEFFKSEKQRISYRDAGIPFLLILVIVVMAFEESISGLPFAERLQEDILPIIAIALAAIAAILFVKSKNEIYYLHNIAQLLASWHRDPLQRIEDFYPGRYGEERDIPRSVVLYSMMTRDAPDPENATGEEAYYRHIVMAQVNIRKTAIRALDLHGEWRTLYLTLSSLEKRCTELLPRAEQADSQRLYHLRSLLLFLYARGGSAELEGDFWQRKPTQDYLDNASDFPPWDDQQREAVAQLYRRAASALGKGKNRSAEFQDETALLSAAGIPAE